MSLLNLKLFRKSSRTEVVKSIHSNLEKLDEKIRNHYEQYTELVFNSESESKQIDYLHKIREEKKNKLEEIIDGRERLSFYQDKLESQKKDIQESLDVLEKDTLLKNQAIESTKKNNSKSKQLQAELSEKIRELQRSNEQLDLDLIRVKESSIRHDKAITELKSEVSVASETLSRKKEEFERSRIENNNSQENIEILSKRLDTTIQEASELNREIILLNDVKEKTQSSIKFKKKEILNLEHSIKVNESKIIELKENITDYKESYEHEDRRVVQSQNTIDLQKEQLSGLVKEERTLSDIIARKREEVERCNKEVNDNSDSIDKAKVKHKTLFEQVFSLNNELKILTKEVEAKKNKSREIIVENEKLSRDKENFEKSLRLKEIESSEAQGKLIELDSRRQNELQGIEDLKNKQKKIEKNLTELNLNLKLLETEKERDLVVSDKLKKEITVKTSDLTAKRHDKEILDNKRNDIHKNIKKTENEIINVEQNISIINAQLDENNSKIFVQQKHEKDLRRQLKKLKDGLLDREEECSSNRAALNEIKNLCLDLNGQIVDLNTRNDEAVVQNEGLAFELSQKEETSSTLSNEVSRLSDILRSETSKKSELENNLSNVTQVTEKLRSEIESLESKNKSIGSDISILLESNSGLEKVRSEYEKELIEKKCRFDDLKQQKNIIIANNSKIENDIKSNDINLNEKRSAITGLEKSIENLKNSEKTLKLDLLNVSGQLNIAVGTFEKVKKEESEILEICKSIKKEKAISTEKLDSLKLGIRELEDRIKDNKKSEVELQSGLTLLLDELCSAADDERRKKQKIISIESELIKKKKQLETIKVKIQEAQTEINTKKEEIVNYESVNEKYISDIKSAEGNLNSKNEQIENLNNKVISLKEESSRLEHNLLNTVNKSRERQRDIVNINRSVDSYNSEFLRLQDSFNNANEQLITDKDEKASRTKYLAELKSSIDQLHDKKSGLNLKSHQLRSDIGEIQKETVLEESIKIELENEIRGIDKNSNELEKELYALKAEVKDLREANSELIRNKTSFESTIIRLKDSKGECQNEVKKLSGDNQKLQNLIDDMKSKIDFANKENERLLNITKNEETEEQLLEVEYRKMKFQLEKILNIKSDYEDQINALNGRKKTAAYETNILRQNMIDIKTEVTLEKARVNESLKEEFEELGKQIEYKVACNFFDAQFTFVDKTINISEALVESLKALKDVFPKICSNYKSISILNLKISDEKYLIEVSGTPLKINNEFKKDLTTSLSNLNERKDGKIAFKVIEKENRVDLKVQKTFIQVKSDDKSLELRD